MSAVSSITVPKALAGEEISLSFAGFQVLDHVNFVLLPGRIHAITGGTGTGKSSLAKVLEGVLSADSGVVKLGSEVVQLHTPREAQRRGISLIHQEPLPFEELTVAENVLCGHLPKRFGHVDWPTARALASDGLARLGVTMDVNRIAEGLSIADQQLLELANALALGSTVLIFDETTAPLTPAETRDLFRVIRALASEGCAIGIVSHHMHEIFEIADEITVLRDGKKIAHLETSKTTPLRGYSADGRARD